MTDERRMTRFGDDVGMTIVEIMIAAVVFFIVLTAILGLVGVSTNMGLQAKSTTVMTNAINSYAERVQAMAFDSVITDGSEGALSVETTTVGEYTVTITPTVREYEVAGEVISSLKYVDIVVTVASARGDSTTQYTTITVRDRSELMSQAVSNPATDPTVEWGLMMAPEDTVVWDHNWEGGELFIDVDATAKDGRTVEAVTVYVGTSVEERILESIEPVKEAQWLPSTETFSTDASFIWNTHQTKTVIVGEIEHEEEWIEDGQCLLTAWVTDSENVRVSVTRHVLVDNDPPPTPHRPTVQAASATSSVISWDPVYDGLTLTDYYVMQLWRICTPEEYDLWGDVYAVRLPDVQTEWSTVDYSTVPFTMHIVRVGAGSPRFAPDPAVYSDWSQYSEWWVSKPLVTGSYTVTKTTAWTTEVTLTCSEPNFPTNGVAYKWERIASNGSVKGLGTTTENTITDVLSAPAAQPAPAYQYRCTVEYQPWYLTTSSFTVSSNTVGPTTGVSATFDEGTW